MRGTARSRVLAYQLLELPAKRALDAYGICVAFAWSQPLALGAVYSA